MSADALDKVTVRTRRLEGWQGIALITATYIYFLIFAQFGFLKRLDDLGIAGSHLKVIMAAMATGGILSSLIAPRIPFGWNPSFRMRLALGGCGVAALLATLRLTPLTGAAIATLIGLSLGLLTVTLVANLDSWIGSAYSLVKVAIGTGLGYFVCNIPSLFNASPRTIALISALVCLAAVVASGTIRVEGGRTSHVGVVSSGSVENRSPSDAMPFSMVLVWFSALIWFDSAAFFIIQNSPALKSGTWAGAGHLWRTGILHLAAALVSAWLIAKRGVATTLLCAFASLAGACLLLLHPPSASLTAVLYPVGVSLYSVGLVAAPSFLLRTSSRRDRARKAGWIYAIAGWLGSAMGIGMAQNLHRVPPAFVAVAGTLFLIPWLWRLSRDYRLQFTAIVLSLGMAAALHRTLSHPPEHSRAASSEDLIALGHRTYIAEGCIHCHSQYVRPHSQDVLLWGPAQSLEDVRRQTPPLIGNRRQGPDLSEVGSRRSPLWLRMHFINPRDVSYRSVMPSYAHLFADQRGDALVAYVESLKTTPSRAHLYEVLSTWKPDATAMNTVDPARGESLFEEHCATCHVPAGISRSRWGGSFRRLPPIFGTAQLLHVAPQDTLRIARIIKYGIPGTDMPGHEYLPDSQIAALAAWVSSTSGNTKQ
jgi:hypothetical protein